MIPGIVQSQIQGEQPAAGGETVDWTISDISAASYDSASYESSESTALRSVMFSSDGLKMFLLDASQDIYQYSLSSPWDITTASYDSLTYAFPSNTVDACFSSDGLYMFAAISAGQLISRFSLASAWDLTSVTDDGASFDYDTSADSITPFGVAFNDDGTRMYVVEPSGDTAVEYTLSSANDPSSATATTETISVVDNVPGSLVFNPQGSQMFVVGYSTDRVRQFSLSTDFDFSTISNTSNTFSVATQLGNATGIAFNGDGTKMFICGTGSDFVYQYSTS